jgi:hypothetical protein
MNEVFPKGQGRRRPWIASAIAVVVATLLLVIVVLPAEYGVDPTSAGRLLGLTKLSAPEPAGEAASLDELEQIMAGNTVPAAAGSHSEHSAAWSGEEVVIELASLEEVEWKARVAAGGTILYEWHADAPVYVDAHGEPYDYPESPAVRYREVDGIATAYGRITASFDGLHGWYWLNTNEQPLSIRLRLVGYYEDLGEVFRSAR